MKTIQEQETEAFLQLVEGMKAMEIQLALANHQLRMANERVRQLESQVFGGGTK